MITKNYLTRKIRFYRKCAKNIRELKLHGQNPTQLKNNNYIVAYNDAVSKVEILEELLMRC